MITCTTLNAKSDTYYADLIADFYIINKQASAEWYRLNDTLSRAELAKIATNLSGFSVEKCTGGIYADVKSNLWDLCWYIETLAKSQIISTSNKYFRPNDKITRAEAIKILLWAIWEWKSTTTAWYVDTKNLGDLEWYINRAREILSIPNTEYIYPNSAILRNEVFILASFYAGIDTSTPAFQNDSPLSYYTTKAIPETFKITPPNQNNIVKNTSSSYKTSQYEWMEDWSTKELEDYYNHQNENNMIESYESSLY